MTTSHVELRALRKTYGDFVAVEGVSLSVPAGEFLVILGPSGSGKTTVLSMLGGFTEPTSGRILIGGEDCTHVAPARRPTVTVFQDYALFPHMSVAGNVAFGLEMRGIARAERERRLAEALATVGLAGFGSRRIQQLSGGQRQRVALARAIAVQPSVLLLDEPLGALDLKIRRQMQEELVELQRSLGTTFIHVTHDQDEAMSMANNIVLMNNGRIEDYGPPDRVYLRPASLFAATFMGESNVFRASARVRGGELAVDCGFVQFGLDPGQGSPRLGANGTPAHLSIRPEHLRLGIAPDATAVSLGRARLIDTVFQDAFRRCQAMLGADPGLPVWLRLPQDTAIPAGESIELHVYKRDMVVLVD